MTAAAWFTMLVIACAALLLGAKIYRLRKDNVEDFKNNCLHSYWEKGFCRRCGKKENK